MIAPIAKSQRTSKRNRHQPTPACILNYRLARAAILDRLADQEIAYGRHQAAERLSHRAAEMREASA